MARPSHARTAAEIAAPGEGIDQQALAEAGTALAQRGVALAAFEERFGQVMPYNLDAYVSRIKLNVAETGQRLVEIGLMLQEIRQRETPELYAATLDQVGFTARFAQRAIQAAVKTDGLPKLQQLGSGKLLELIAEDDDTLAGLEDGGDVAGLTLDDVDRMTVRELRTALRNERADREADRDIIRAKDERINKLTRDKRKGSAEDKLRREADALPRDADAAVVEATSQIATINRLASEINQLYADAGMTVDADVETRLQANGAWAQQQLAELAELTGE